MKFRPCIDIHNGKVVQIVGATLSDKMGSADTNFVSEKDSAYFASLYKGSGLYGGHVIILNSKNSKEYNESENEALKALDAFKGGLGIGGGITADNAEKFIKCGASHVIVTSYVFSGGNICYNNLAKLNEAVTKKHIVLDISCKKRDGKYFVATDRWQKVSDVEFNKELLAKLSDYCDEYLVHAVDSEGKKAGIDEDIAGILRESPIPVTYAGGISSYSDIEKIKTIGNGKIDFTIGSALDIFGGELNFSEVIKCSR